MRVLIDTNVFLWFIAGSDRLNNQAKNIMTDMNNELVLSVASLWEIAIKSSLGKLELLRPFDQLIPEQLELHEVDVLQIELTHLSRIISLPFHHRDPFDRLIIAQSITENLPIITSDTVFQQYPVQIIM
jgi:PIN domain nuclease of toxin-antitoxin system